MGGDFLASAGHEETADEVINEDPQMTVPLARRALGQLALTVNGIMSPRPQS